MKYKTDKFEELKVTYPVDCGNAPKKLLLKNFHEAIAKNDLTFVSENLIEDCTWHIIGEQQIDGKENIIDSFKSENKIVELDIDYIITHGKITSINGSYILDNSARYSFCHVHIFNNASKQAKIKETTSYLIKTSTPTDE